MTDDIDAARPEAVRVTFTPAQMRRLAEWGIVADGSRNVAAHIMEVLGRVLGQPPPQPGTGDVWAEILASGLLSPELAALAEERRRVGIERYGTPLQRDNGRDHLADALWEALDLIVYLRAAGWSFERIDYFVKGAEQIVAEMRMREEG